MPGLIRWFKRLLLIALAIAISIWISHKVRDYRADKKELAGFEELARLERDMIKAGGTGIIVSPNGQARVRTFADFYNYVAKVRPSAVRSPTYLPTSQPAEGSGMSPNPFPAILPESEYELTDTETEFPEEDIMTTRTHHRWSGPFRAILDASGKATWHGMGM